MNLDKLKDLPREKLLDIIEMTLNNFRTLDGLWFLGVEELYGTETATAIDTKVWEGIAPYEVRRLRRTLGLEKEGIAGLVEALENSTCWISFASEFEVEQVDDKRAVFRVLDCRPQLARKEKGMELFPCRGVELAYLHSFARAIDPSIKTSCGFSPPDEPRGHVWCEWWFEEE